MRHRVAGRTFNRDTNARQAMFIGLAKNLIEKEQIKTTLPKAKDLRGVVEKLITRAKVDTIANRRLTASELGNASNAAVKKLFTVLGPRYAKRPGGYTRVLKAGFRYGDAAPMAIIELVDRDENAKKATPKTVAMKNEAAKSVSDKKVEPVAEEAEAKKASAPKATKTTKVAAEKKSATPKATGAKKTVAVKRRATGK